MATHLPPTRRQVRAALGAVWLVDAGLQTAPALFTPHWWRDDLAQSVMGAPVAVNRSILWAVNIIAVHATAWNSLFVAVQAAIGLALLIGRLDRAAIVLSLPWALGVWWVGEGFGMLPTGFALLAAGAPGAVLLYALIGLLAWPEAIPHAGARSSISRRAGGAAWVLLWAGQSLLQVPWAFPAKQVLSANIEETSAGQPGWLLGTAQRTESLVGHHAVALSIVMVAVQVAVGVGIAGRRTRRPALVAGMAVSVVYWITFQYLGRIPAGDATDPSSAPLLLLLAIALWPVSTEAPRPLDPSLIALDAPGTTTTRPPSEPGALSPAGSRTQRSRCAPGPLRWLRPGPERGLPPCS